MTMKLIKDCVGGAFAIVCVSVDAITLYIFFYQNKF